jgi:crotonobetainyl-CoA:carnitine CoA-transferase CaiB-like acyl-CoA transferase
VSGDRGAGSPLPLDGVRVIEVGTMIAAPYAAAILGDLGASVVKVESPDGDALRQSALLSGTHFRFNEANRNKQAVCLDLSRPGGQAVFRTLVAAADVIICNLRPDVVDKLGLDHETLRESNQAIITIRLSAFGATGPHAWRRGTAPTIDGASGLASLNGYPGRGPLRPGGFYPDLTSALFSVYGVLAALRHRDATGEGQEVDVAMTECAGHLVGEALMGMSFGRDAGPQGNGHPEHAPNNCYPCRAPDSWIAISVETDEDWARLRHCMGDPGWARADRFATSTWRKENEPALDQLVGEWTAGQEPAALLKVLRHVGLAAALVAKASDILDDPQLTHRRFFRTVTQPGSGRGPLPRIAFPSPFGRDWCESAAPEFAQHNDVVFRDVVRLNDEQIEQLYTEGASRRHLQGQPRPGESRGLADVATGFGELRVLEFGSAPSGQYCAYLLAGLGAEVIKVSAEPVSGSRDPRSAGNAPDEAELRDLYLDSAKHVQPLTPAGDQNVMRQLVERADVVVDSREAADREDADRDGPSDTAMTAWNSRLVLARISWFGSSGPYAGLRATELTCAATSGYLSMNGFADREPLKLYGVQSQRHAGLQASIAVLAALRVRDRTGEGAVIDVSVQESLVYLTAGAPLDYFHTGSVRRRSGNSQAASTRGQTYTSIMRCADGFILLGMVGARDFARLEQLMDQSLASSSDHMREFPGAHEAELNEICGNWLSARRRADVLDRALACGLHWALVNDMSDVAASDQVQARGFLVRAVYEGRDVMMPGRPIVFGQIGWRTGWDVP